MKVNDGNLFLFPPFVPSSTSISYKSLGFNTSASRSRLIHTLTYFCDKSATFSIYAFWCFFVGPLAQYIVYVFDNSTFSYGSQLLKVKDYYENDDIGKFVHNFRTTEYWIGT